MCKCNPMIKTPYCGAPGCEWPVVNHVCVKCGVEIDSVFVSTGKQDEFMHPHCYEQDHPPMVATSVYQMARGRGDPVLAAKVIAEYVVGDLADEIVTEFNRRLMIDWRLRCSP